MRRTNHAAHLTIACQTVRQPDALLEEIEAENE